MICENPDGSVSYAEEMGKPKPKLKLAVKQESLTTTEFIMYFLYHMVYIF